MKRILFLLLALICLNFQAVSAQTVDNYESKDPSAIFKIDISTLKYDQKQLVYAILVGKTKDVETILNSDDSPKKTYANIPLVLYAVYANHLDVLKILVEHSFDPEETFMNVSPLELAIYLDRYEIVKYLLDLKVDISQDAFIFAKKSKDKRINKIFDELKY